MKHSMIAFMQMSAKPLLGLLVAAAVLMAGGCAKFKKAESGVMKDGHVVISGESLWVISEYEDIYNDPFQWPLLYKNNVDQIKDADLIHPGQKLVVRRDESSAEVSRAIDHAKSRGAWSIGIVESSDQEYLQGN